MAGLIWLMVGVFVGIVGTVGVALMMGAGSGDFYPELDDEEKRA